MISPRPGARQPRLLPSLAAIQVIGPGTLDARGHTFAVLGRTNDYAWMLVGPTGAPTNGAINVVALEGGAPVPSGGAGVHRVRPGARRSARTGGSSTTRPGDRDGFTVATNFRRPPTSGRPDGA